jgi:hypothetical protein
MDSKNAATRQDVVVNSVHHQISSLANSAASPGQLEALLTSELGHDLIAWPRQYLETYLDSDATGRVPIDAEQLQDILEAAFDRDAALARESLEELTGERGLRLGDSTLQITSSRTAQKETEYELLFDPADAQDLRDLIGKLDIRVWERQKVQPTPPLETQFDTERRESIAFAFVSVHEPGSSAVKLHDKTTGTDVRKLLGGEPPSALQLALKQMAPDARVELAQTDSGTYRGRIIGETEKSLIQQITSHSAVVHRKDLLDVIPAVGESVRVGYSNDNARVLPVKERSREQELGR